MEKNRKTPETEFEILIDAICSISQVLAIHQVVNDEEFLYNGLCLGNPNLSKELFEKALTICDENGVITGRGKGMFYQTNSLLYKQKTWEEVHEFIKKCSLSLSNSDQYHST